MTGHSPGTAKKGSVVAGGEGAAGGQALTSSPYCPPHHFTAQSKCFHSGKQETLQRTGPGVGVGGKVLIQNSQALRERRFQNLHHSCHRHSLTPVWAEHRPAAKVQSPRLWAETALRSADNHHMEDLRGADSVMEIGWASWRSRQRTDCTVGRRNEARRVAPGVTRHILSGSAGGRVQAAGSGSQRDCQPRKEACPVSGSWRAPPTSRLQMPCGSWTESGRGKKSYYKGRFGLIHKTVNPDCGLRRCSISST